MCTIAIAWRAHPRYRLILAANHDEFHARLTLPLAEWANEAAIVGGRDDLHGGSWLAMRGRRLAAVTNVRRLPEQAGRSRGELVADFVRSDADTAAALHALATADTPYRLFNLLAYDGDTLAFATNRADDDSAHSIAVSTLAPGIHGVSNGALDAPWPKTETLMARLNDWLTASAAQSAFDDMPDLDSLFTALADRSIAPDARLPNTGIGLERERFLSPAFIAHAIYGTKASTVVLIADDHAQIVERRFSAEGMAKGATKMRMALAD